MDDTLSSVSNDKTEGEGTTIAEGNANYDTGLRLVASFITAVLSLSLLFFLIHRLRQRKIRGTYKEKHTFNSDCKIDEDKADSIFIVFKGIKIYYQLFSVCVAGRQNRQAAEDQRSLGSMGYLERGGLQHGVPMDDIPCGGGYPLWKPPGNYFPRGEAPPPYDEAVAAARAEQVLLSTSPHALSPLNFPCTYLTNNSSNSSMPLVTNSQNGLPASSPTLSSNNGASTSPLIPPPNRPLSSPGTHSNCYQLSQSESASTGLYAGTSTTSFTMGTNTYENLPAVNISSITPQHSVVASNMLLLPTPHSATPKTYHHHTTLPRQGGAFTISATLPNSGGVTHRTIPRSLATTGSLRLRREFLTHQPIAPLFDAPPKCTSPLNSPRSAPPSLPISDNAIRSDALYEDVLVSKETTAHIEGNPPEVTPLMCDYKVGLLGLES